MRRSILRAVPLGVYLGVVTFLAVALSSAHAGTPQNGTAPALAANGAAPDTTVIKSDVREVVLDVIVRRKSMALEKKLQAGDFTVFEDGVPQQIRSFRFVRGRDAYVAGAEPPKSKSVAENATKIAVSQANSTRETNFITIIFDQVPATELVPARNAIEAANYFLDAQLPDNSYAAVLKLNFRLNAVQGFTNDRELLRRAIETAVRGSSSHLANASAAVLNQTTFSASSGPGGITIAPASNLATMPDLATGSADSNPYSESQQALGQMISEQRYQTSYVTGMNTWDALLNMIRIEARVPGRKIILYLSQALVNPPGRRDIVRRVISEANRANVTFYCIDVTGLTGRTTNGVSNGLLRSAAAMSRSQRTVPESPSAGREQMKQDDLLELGFASNYQINMDELATSTGGFAIFSTNDFKKNMTRIMEDVRTHYEISYVPTSSIYDGRFRQIKIQLKDPRLSVQSRDGYFALPEIRGWQVQPFETRALHAIDSKQHDFEFTTGAFRFRPTGDGFSYEMGFEVPTGSLAAPVDPATHQARLHATFLALLKDRNGQVVDHVSQEIDRDVPEDKLAQFQNGVIVFTSPFQAPAGYYTVDAAVVDPEGHRAATKRVSLAVPRPGLPSVSSIQLVRQVQPLTEPRDPGNPLEFDGGRISPAIRQRSRAGQETALFFVVYPNRSAAGFPTAAAGPETKAERPRVSITVRGDDNREFVHATPDIGTLDEVNSFPMIQPLRLPAGRYVAQVSVEQSGRVSTESVAFQIDQ